MKKITIRKNANGITLIALVITIIVLLILAGVSIAMLTGQNGILTQAQNAKTTNENKSAEEKVKLAIMAAKSQSETGALDADKLIAEITNNYGGTASKTNDGFPVNTTVDGKNFSIDEDGNITANNSGSSTPTTGGVTAADIANATQEEKQSIYGATVTGYILPSGTTTDVGWKIFYADNSNIYLIADNYVEINNLPNSTTELGVVTANKPKPNDGDSDQARSAYFSDILGDYAGSSRITDSRLKALNNDYFNTKNYSSTDNNIKAVAYMMDTKAWNSKFKDTNNKAEYCIGGPNVELLFKSYNEKYKTAYESQASSDTGYQIRETSSDSWNDGVVSTLSTSDPLYVITSESNAYGYWLASPSAYINGRVMTVGFNGTIGYNYYASNYDGFRPLVCLKSNIKLQKVSNTQYAIQ